MGWERWRKLSAVRIGDGLTFVMDVPLACALYCCLALYLVLLVRHFPSTTTATMPIAPITGKLRKQFWLDIGCAFGLGISAGYAYW